MSSQPTIAAFSRTVAGALITVTRPNNVTAYVAGQVFGAAADARISFAVPALPADAVRPFSSLTMVAIDRVIPSAGAPTINLVLFSAQPATVLADQANLALSDADIATVLPTLPGSQAMQFGAWPAGVGAVGAVNVTSRRQTASTWSPVGNGSITPGVTLWFYLWVQVAYTPVANEVLTLQPLYSYQARVL